MSDITTTVKPKKRRVIQFKEKWIERAVLAEMRLHDATVRLERFNTMPFIARVIWAVKGGAK